MKDNVINVLTALQGHPRHVFTAFSLRTYVNDKSVRTVRETVEIMIACGLPIVATDAAQGAWLYVA